MKQPIALLVTDTHLKDTNIPLVENIWQQAIDKCKELGIYQIFFLGDFFDSRKGQPLTVLKAAQRIIESLQNYNVVALAGNHDKANYESFDSFLDIFDSENFRVINSTQHLLVGGLKIALLPFFKESIQVFREQLEVAKKTPSNILLTHIGINGSITNDNEHIQNCVPSSELSKFDTVFTGHFHNRQEFENILYIGSPYQANYGEDDNKGFTVLYSDGSYEFTKTKFPQYQKYTLSLSNLNEEQILEAAQQKQEGNNIRLEITGESEQLKAFDRSILTDLGIEVVLKPSESILTPETSQTITHDKNSLREAYFAFNKELNREPNEYELNKLEEI